MAESRLCCTPNDMISYDRLWNICRCSVGTLSGLCSRWDLMCAFHLMIRALKDELTELELHGDGA